MDHASFSPSSMSRIIKCPASWKEAQQAPHQPTSEFAKRGTLLHEVVAQRLVNKPEPTFPEEDKGYVADGLEYVKNLINSCDDRREVIVEKRVSLREWGIPQVWGTADVIVRDWTTNVIHVVDYKFGHGVQVFAAQNPQQMIYAAGAAGYPSNFNIIQLHIVQPTLDHYDTYKCDVEEMEEFIFGVVKTALDQAKSSAPEYHPSKEACQFCPAGMTCRARFDKALKETEAIFAAIDTPPHNLTIKDLTILFNKTEDIVKYRSEIGKYLLSKALDGEKVPGKKVVAGRSLRRWEDEARVQRYLTDNGYPVHDMFEAKFFSPAKVEKAFRKLKKDETFQTYISKPPGKPQLVDADDKRPDYQDPNNFFKGV